MSNMMDLILDDIGKLSSSQMQANKTKLSSQYVSDDKQLYYVVSRVRIVIIYFLKFQQNYDKF